MVLVFPVIAVTAAVLLDRILVVVNGQPITQSKVDLFRDYLVVTGAAGLGWPHDFDDARSLSPDAMLDIVVTDELLFDNAGNVNVVRVSDSAVEDRLAAFRRRFGTGEAFRAFEARQGWNLEMEREFFSRRLRVEGYIKFKLGFEPPDRDELHRYYDAHRHRYRNRPFEEVRDRVSFEYFRDRYKKDFDRWIVDLKKRAVLVVPERQIAR